MNSETFSLIRRSNSTPNYARSKTNDFMFFVLRNKASTSENTNTFQDVFCVVHDSYADRINKGNNTFAITQAQRKLSTVERISTTCGNNLSLQSTLWNTNEKENHNLDIKTSFNLKLFRDYLKFFDIHPNSSISYMDNKQAVRSVQTETEFLELWKLAKLCSMRNKGVLLLIDFTNNPDDDIVNSNDKILTPNDQKILNIDNANLANNLQLKERTIEENNANAQSSNKLVDQCDDYDTFTPVLNLSTSSSRIFTKENDDKNLETAISSNVNSQDFVNKTPPSWFAQYMEQFKQDIIKEVSDQVMVYVKKNLNECPMKSPRHARFEKIVHTENHRSRNDSVLKVFFMDRRKVHKMVAKNRKKKEKKFEEKLKYNIEDNNSIDTANKHNKKCNISKLADDMNSICISNNATVENEVVNNHNSMPPYFLESQQSSKGNMCDAMKENEFRMSCSVTEDQMLDKINFSSETCGCGCNTENISINSSINNEEDLSTECNFEMIQKPSLEEFQHFSTNKEKKPKKSSNYQVFNTIFKRHPPIHIDEDHFTADSNNILTSSENCDLNIPNFYKPNDKESSEPDNINAKMIKVCPFNISNKYQVEDVKELTSSICNKLIENSLYPTHKEVNTESECSIANNFKTNVNDSHTSYMTTKSINTVNLNSPKTQHSCQAQTDLNDLTQSFHSHTTSIADNGVYCIGETNTTTSHDYSKHSLSNLSKPTNSKENRTCEEMNKDISDKDADNKISREKNNIKSSKRTNEDAAVNSISGTAEPVHILPETLVTGALHFASFAIGTAREAIVKIRSSSKDDRLSHARKARH